MPHDLIRVEYARTGASSNTNDMGMREMQARAFESRNSQYLLLKAPPASGKSRALMFLALDKLINQGIRKAIVAVPETSIGGSFKNEPLTQHGFFADWNVLPEHNLCLTGTGTDKGKVSAFKAFMERQDDDLKARTLVCTHATLRFAFDQLGPEPFSGTVLAIDEFHHVSADGDNKLGNLIDSLMRNSTAHIVAMTGSYFRGDTIPILLPEDEAMFDKVTYTYYEQLNGYKHLKSLGIGYHFYQGRYIDALTEVLDIDQKTIIHIPNVNSGESTKDKYTEVDHIIDAIGGDGLQTVEDPATSVIEVRRADGRTIKVANLVNEDPKRRPLLMAYLRDIEKPEDMDIIIALGMAKEGFDWPFCSKVLTIGYRQSMTEVIQIIGRATRDAPGKQHAQFTNLIAQPTADDDDVKQAVNNMLKAITVSLLMEQVLAPTFQFKPRQPGGGLLEPGTIKVGDGTTPPSKKVTDILNGSAGDITAALLQQPGVAASLLGGGIDPEVITQSELPKLIQTKFPDLDEDEVEHVRQGIATQWAVTASGGLVDQKDLPPDAEFIGDPPDDEDTESPTEFGSKQFIKLSDKFINIENLNVDLIDQVNPFRGAFEVLSKSVTAPVLKTIQDEVVGTRIRMTDEEVVILWPKIEAFVREKGRQPSLQSSDPVESRYAEAIVYAKRRKREKAQSANS